MKRDMDLVREILIQIEKHGCTPTKLTIDGYSDEQIGFHISLMGDGGLLETQDVTSRTSQSRQGVPIKMKWAGYEFLDLSRNNEIWQEAKQKGVQKAIGLPFDIIKLILTTITKTMLGV